MFEFIWPIALVIFSNVFYQICAKSLPDTVNPFASLTVTYAVGAVMSLVFYFALVKDANLLREYKNLNLAPFVLGLVIVGLEVGYLYAYKVGWSVSTAPIVQAAALSVVLIFVGYFLYKEAITFTKLIGVVVCIIGLVLINRK